MSKRKPFTRFFIVICGPVFLFVILSLIFFGGHIFNRNSLERARRTVCMYNLNGVKHVLDERNIKLGINHLDDIKAIIEEYNELCLSGLKVHSNDKKAAYFIENLADNTLIITEDKDNHNSNLMIFTDLPYVQYYLYALNDDKIKIGEWKHYEEKISAGKHKLNNIVFLF